MGVLTRCENLEIWSEGRTPLSSVILRRILTSRGVHIWTNSIISIPIAHIETLNEKTWSKELASCQHVCYAVFNVARQANRSKGNENATTAVLGSA